MPLHTSIIIIFMVVIVIIKWLLFVSLFKKIFLIVLLRTRTPPFVRGYTTGWRLWLPVVLYLYRCCGAS
jgi:hypothetical protein